MTCPLDDRKCWGSEEDVSWIIQKTRDNQFHDDRQTSSENELTALGWPSFDYTEKNAQKSGVRATSPGGADDFVSDGESGEECTPAVLWGGKTGHDPFSLSSGLSWPPGNFIQRGVMKETKGAVHSASGPFRKGPSDPLRALPGSEVPMLTLGKTHISAMAHIPAKAASFKASTQKDKKKATSGMLVEETKEDEDNFGSSWGDVDIDSPLFHGAEPRGMDDDEDEFGGFTTDGDSENEHISVALVKPAPTCSVFASMSSQTSPVFALESSWPQEDCKPAGSIKKTITTTHSLQDIGTLVLVNQRSNSSVAQSSKDRDQETEKALPGMFAEETKDEEDDGGGSGWVDIDTSLSSQPLQAVRCGESAGKDNMDYDDEVGSDDYCDSDDDEPQEVTWNTKASRPSFASDDFGQCGEPSWD